MALKIKGQGHSHFLQLQIPYGSDAKSRQVALINFRF